SIAEQPAPSFFVRSLCPAPPINRFSLDRSTAKKEFFPDHSVVPSSIGPAIRRYLP
ncbi:hypothetical protein Dimus_011758, partial [Dionaea muscipula]